MVPYVKQFKHYVHVVTHVNIMLVTCSNGFSVYYRRDYITFWLDVYGIRTTSVTFLIIDHVFSGKVYAHDSPGYVITNSL